MIIVSDTSPIINFAIIGRLDILPALFGQVIIPLVLGVPLAGRS